MYVIKELDRRLQKFRAAVAMSFKKSNTHILSAKYQKMIKKANYQISILFKTSNIFGS